MPLPSSSQPSPAFQNAAAWLSSSPSASKASNNVKLELYGLFKYITTSRTPNTSRPGLLDFTGRAKWDAWKQAGAAYGDDVGKAEGRYLAIARDMGWTEEAVASTSSAAPVTREDSPSAEELLAMDADSGSEGGGGERTMGTVMSTIGSPTQYDAHTLHGIAASGTTEEIEAFLDQSPNIDINARDSNGYTPLHLASDRGNRAAVKTLLARGADRTLKDPDEMTALELARIAEHDDVVALLQ